MSINLDSQQKEDLRLRIQEDTGMYFFGNELDKLIRIFEEKVGLNPAKEYQKLVTDEKGEYRRNCPTCHQSYRIWKCDFQVRMLPALKYLHMAGKPMTVKEITEQIGNSRDERSHFCKMKHWGLIHSAGGRKYMTNRERCDQFFNNAIRMPEYVWVFQDERVDAPKDERDGNPLLISQMRYNNKPVEEIIDEAVSAFGQDINPV